MLVDAHKPLRTGEGVKYDSADKKIKGWMKGVSMEPRLNNVVEMPADGADVLATNAGAVAEDESVNPHRTTIPPHLHRPWHSTYTGAFQTNDTPQVKYGTFIKRKADGNALTNLLELQLPPGADGKLRAKVKHARRSEKATRRFDQAREGAIDYRLGLGTEGGQVIEFEEMELDEDDETFRGNRQVRGSSVLGAQKGNASGMKAWGGLVEDRIQVSQIITNIFRTELILTACTRLVTGAAPFHDLAN
jgi:aarF domain-containing kinase